MFVWFEGASDPHPSRLLLSSLTPLLFKVYSRKATKVFRLTKKWSYTYLLSDEVEVIKLMALKMRDWQQKYARSM